MERKLTVLVESNMTKTVLNSNATTLGELKNELKRNGVYFNSDCVFKEALTKTILSVDDSVLPSNVPWKGTTTNDLIFMVTAPYSKIKSGAGYSRKELYELVKKYKLEDHINYSENKNFTRCSNDALNHHILQYEKDMVSKAIDEHASDEKPEVSLEEIQANLFKFIDNLLDEKCISPENASSLQKIAEGGPLVPVHKDEDDSYASIASMFTF